MLKTIMAIGAGSFVGGTARFLISKTVTQVSTSSFPWATFLINILGCFIVGVVYGLFEKGSLGGENLKMFLTVGFCGGFTTFSTFIHENYVFVSDKNFLPFVIYASVSFAAGLIFAYLGHLLVKAF